MDSSLPDVDLRSHRALAHPLRHRLLMALRVEPATISGLARRLDVQKGSIAHHLRVLVEAGMVRPAQSRQVRGGTEQYYEIAVGRIDSGPGNTTALLSAVAAEVAAADDPLLHLRHVRLTQQQAAAVRAALEAIVENAPSNDGAPAYGVLVGLYPMSS